MNRRPAQWLAALGLPGVLGLALLALAAWMHWGETPLEAQALAEQQDQIRLLREQLQRSTDGQSSAKTEAIDTQAAWQRFWQALPDAQQGSRQQESILAKARQRGVVLGGVQFQGEAVPGLPQVWRQRMTMPVQATYPALRLWMTDVLNAPDSGAVISLDALDLSRDDVMSPELKARVVWSIWWRAAP